MRVTMKKGKQKNNATTRAGRKEELTAYLCLIPAFLGVTLISYLPTLAVFVLSLFDWNGITKPEFIGLANFQRIFTKDIYFWDSIKATVWYAFLAVIGAVVYSLIIAILLNMNIKGRTLFRSLFFIPYLLPAIGVFKGWEWLYEGNFGLFNFVLRMMGLPKQRFLDDPNQVIPCLVLIAIWTSGNMITECPRRIHRSSEDRWGQCMAEILEYYDPQYHSHYLLQCVDSTDHTFTGHQPGTGADQRRTR